MFEAEAVAAGLGHDAADLILGHQDIRLGRVDRRLLQVDLDLIRLLVELHQQIALSHAIVVVDQNLGHLARDARRHERDVAVDIGVVGRNGVERTDQPADTDQQHHQPDQSARDPTAPVAVCSRLAQAGARATGGRPLGRGGRGVWPSPRAVSIGPAGRRDCRREWRCDSGCRSSVGMAVLTPRGEKTSEDAEATPVGSNGTLS